MVPASSIEEPFQALKSTCPKRSSAKAPHWSFQRGVESENIVVQHYQAQDFELLAQRVKTPFAEVDLIFKTPQGHLLMVEVKTTNLSDFQMFRISKKQRARLVRALIFLAERTDLSVEIHWAFVTKEGHVTQIEDISG